MEKDLKDVILEYGQYRDFHYITQEAEIIETRCLIVPAKEIEPFLEE